MAIKGDNKDKFRLFTLAGNSGGFNEINTLND